jgi:hypothetical protein
MDTTPNNESAQLPSSIDFSLLPDEQLKRFVSDLVKRHQFHTDLAKELNGRYKQLGPFLMIFIPVYSAILSYLTTGVLQSKVALSLFALVLTVATILNSTVKPDEKFVASANTLVKLKDWEADLALGLHEILGLQEIKDREPKLTEFLRSKSVQLSEIGSSMARTYLPQKNTP